MKISMKWAVAQTDFGLEGFIPLVVNLTLTEPRVTIISVDLISDSQLSINFSTATDEIFMAVALVVV